MADCKACGAWFSSTAPDELCPTCGRALKRLNGYAMPVVRCKDCKHWIKADNGSWQMIGRTDGACQHLMGTHLAERYMTEGEHFCSYGERKNDGICKEG